MKAMETKRMGQIVLLLFVSIFLLFHVQPAYADAEPDIEAIERFIIGFVNQYNRAQGKLIYPIFRQIEYNEETAYHINRLRYLIECNVWAGSSAEYKDAVCDSIDIINVENGVLEVKCDIKPFDDELGGPYYFCLIADERTEYRIVGVKASAVLHGYWWSGMEEIDSIAERRAVSRTTAIEQFFWEAIVNLWYINGYTRPSDAWKWRLKDYATPYGYMVTTGKYNKYWYLRYTSVNME